MVYNPSKQNFFKTKSLEYVKNVLYKYDMALQFLEIREYFDIKG